MNCNPAVIYSQPIGVEDEAVRDRLECFHNVLRAELKVQNHEAPDEQGRVGDVHGVNAGADDNLFSLLVFAASPYIFAEAVNKLEAQGLECHVRDGRT